MDIAQAKQQVKETVIAYLARDDMGIAYIPAEEQRPIFLLGAPGIGKTAIMAQVAEELDVGLVSYSMTHHTRQSALGLPFIVHKQYRSGTEFDISEYTMSEIIASIYDYMEETGKDTGILFLDEINCVSETLYPSMLQFLQFKTFGRHAVPQGWVVACAGNPPEYNRNVHEFDIVTWDRLRRVEVEPSFEAWLGYMRTRRAHPAVMTYLELRHDDFYLVESTPGSKQFVSARSWTELSDLMLLLERLDLTVDAGVIGQYLQHPEIAARFAAYYELFAKYRSDYQVEGILSGSASQEIEQRAAAAPFDERLALMSLLLESLEGNMRDILEQQGVLNAARSALRHAQAEAGCAQAGGPTAAAGDAADATGMPVFPGEDARNPFKASLLQAAERERAKSERSSNAATARAGLHAAGFMEQLAQAGDYEAAAATYRDALSQLETDVQETGDKLECAFAFIDAAFGAGAEMLVFTTELTARRDPAQFIAQFGSDGYFKFSTALSTATERDAIFDEIDALRQTAQ